MNSPLFLRIKRLLYQGIAPTISEGVVIHLAAPFAFLYPRLKGGDQVAREIPRFNPTVLAGL